MSAYIFFCYSKLVQIVTISTNQKANKYKSKKPSAIKVADGSSLSMTLVSDR